MATAAKTVLVVEGDPAHAEPVHEALRRCNLPEAGIVRVFGAADAVKALTLAAVTPALILIDLTEGETHAAWQLLDMVRGTKRGARVPLVVLASSSARHDVSEAYLHGANAFVVKQPAAEDFVAAVCQTVNFWLKHNRLPSSAAA